MNQWENKNSYKNFSTRLTIIGTLRGSLWMGGNAEKQIKHVIDNGHSFSDNTRESMHDTIARICNDGDFQNCELLANSFLQVELFKHNSTSVIRVIRDFDLLNPGLFPTIQDMILNDYPMYNEEF